MGVLVEKMKSKALCVYAEGGLGVPWQLDESSSNKATNTNTILYWRAYPILGDDGLRNTHAHG